MSVVPLTLSVRRWRRWGWRDLLTLPPLLVLVLFLLVMGLLLLLSVPFLLLQFTLGSLLGLVLALLGGLFFGFAGVALLDSLLFEREVLLRLTASGLELLRPSGGAQGRYYSWLEIGGFVLHEHAGRLRVYLIHTPPIGPEHDPWEDPGLDGRALVLLPEGLSRTPAELLALLERWRSRYTGKHSWPR